MFWLPLVLLFCAVFVVVMYLCVAAVTQTPKENRGDRAAELLRDILCTIRPSPRHRS